MTPADGFQIVLCVIIGNFFTFLILALSMPKNKKKDEDKNDTEKIKK